MLIGPYVNGSAVIIGGLIGAMAGGKLPERVKNRATDDLLVSVPLARASPRY